MARAPRQPGPEPLHSVLVPDISPGPEVPKRLAEAAVKAGLHMPLAELGARVALEIALTLSLAKGISVVLHKLADQANKVCSFPSTLLLYTGFVA